MARVLAVVGELLLQSRVESSLRSAGHEVEVRGSLPDAPRADAIVCDLDAVDPVRAAAAGPPVLAFYSHLDSDARQRAAAAGIQMVVPRSRMSRELPALIERLLEDGRG